MRLEDYLWHERETQVSFSRRCGVPPTIISRLCRSGDTNGKNWVQITSASDGWVQPEDHFLVEKHTKRAA